MYFVGRAPSTVSLLRMSQCCQFRSVAVLDERSSGKKMEQIREEGNGIYINQQPIAFPSSFALHLLTSRKSGSPACSPGRPRAAEAPPSAGGATRHWPAASGSGPRSPPRRPGHGSSSGSRPSSAAGPRCRRLQGQREQANVHNQREISLVQKKRKEKSVSCSSLGPVSSW